MIISRTFPSTVSAEPSVSCLQSGSKQFIFFCPKSLKAVVTPECLLVLDFRGLGLDKWLVLELGPQLAGDGALATYSLPFEFRALEAILQHRVNMDKYLLSQFSAEIAEK